MILIKILTWEFLQKIHEQGGIGVIDSFISFFTKYDGKKTHNMETFMFNPRFKSLILIFNSFIACELRAAIATQFDRKFLYSILFLKFNHHLHPLFKIESSFVNKSNEDNSLDIFEMVTHTHELIKEPVNQKLMIFRRFQVDGKDIKCLLEWWKKHESMLVFFSRQILGMISSQIEIERIFFLIHIFTNLKKCHLQLENLENLNSMTKNWPNDVRVGCKAPSSLLEFIDCEIDLKVLDEFENSFEQEELNED